MGRQVNFLSPKPQHAPVLFFNVSTRLSGMSLNASFSMLTSWSLRLAGVPVTHFVCKSGLLHCVLGTSRENPRKRPPCGECRFQSSYTYAHSKVKEFIYQEDREIKTLLSVLSIDQMQDFAFESIPLGALVLPSMRWILRRHHLLDDENTRYLYRNYILSAWSLAGQFRRILDEVQPQSVVVFNGMFYPEATARWIAQQKGLRVISHEVGLMPFCGYFTTGEATAYPIDIPDTFELTLAQNQRLDAYLRDRFQGNFSMAGIRFWPEMHSLGEEFWGEKSIFKQIVPIFTNVVFDTSQGHANIVFSDMFAWLDIVLKIIRIHPETLFVIRAHPDEFRTGKESLESVAQWAEKNMIQTLPNVRFINANESVSSYELIQKSKFVLVYNSTIGLEASILGVPVICGGKARFTQLPTVFLPASETEFYEKVEQFLEAEQIDVPPEFPVNSRRFLYYQLFRTSLPFDAFLEEDGIWRGYVKLKSFKWFSLLPENSPTMKTIQNGILKKGSFLLPE